MTQQKKRNIFPSGEMIPEKFRISEIHQREYLINGEIHKWEGPVQSVESPVRVDNKKTIIGSYPLLTEKEALRALDSACRAYDLGRGKWPLMSVRERIAHVEKFLTEMRTKRDEIVNLLMWEIGKNLASSKKEFDRTCEYIADTVEALKELDRKSSDFEIKDGIIGHIRRSPLGTVLCMGPFNYPLNETFTTLIPALIMGNTVIFKPPKLGVLLHKPLLEAFKNSFPKGVVNTVYGEGQEVIAPIMKTGRVDVLAFIGSSRVADILKHLHPKPHRLRSVLGLEAKNCGIILEDCDMDESVKECIKGSLSFNGQRCTALKILFVQRKRADEFLRKFKKAMSELKAGMPWEDNVSITPLPEKDKPMYLRELTRDAIVHGAEIVYHKPGSEESLFMPALLYPVSPKARIYKEEQFGPLVPVVPFDTIDEPLDYIVNSDYGQQVSIFGNSPKELSELIDPLVNQVCRVNINSQCQRGPDSFPFTGRKDSAEGTLSVSDALRVFSIRALVAAKEREENASIFTEILDSKLSGFISRDFIF